MAVYAPSRLERSGSQYVRFCDTLTKAAERSPFYRRYYSEQGFDVRSVACLDDLSLVPFTTSEHMIAASLDFSTEPAMAVFCSGGTIGRPKYFTYSAADFAAMACRSAAVLRATGVRPGDRVAIADSFGIRSIGHDFLRAIGDLGAVAVPIGRMAPDFTVDIVSRLDVTWMISTPSHVTRLLRYLLDHGIAPQSTIPLKGLLLNGEAMDSNRRRFIEQEWRAIVYSLYGAGEVGTIGAECHIQNGLHIFDEDFLLEVLDPQTLQPVPEGVVGELVLTTLERASMPLIRYRLGDLVRWIPGECPCGQAHRRLTVQGRQDHGIAFQSGNKIYAFQIEAVLARHPEVVDYQVIVTATEDKDVLLLRAVPAGELREDQLAALSADLTNLSIDFAEDAGKTCIVRVDAISPEDLVLSASGKSVKLLDRRTLGQA